MRPWAVGEGAGSGPDARVPGRGPAGAGALRSSAANPGRLRSLSHGPGLCLGSVGIFSRLLSDSPLHRSLVLNLSSLSGRTVTFPSVLLNCCFSAYWPCIPASHFPLLPLLPTAFMSHPFNLVSPCKQDPRTYAPETCLRFTFFLYESN